MDAEKLTAALFQIIEQIQTASGLPCPPLSGSTKPVGTIPKFDSKVWPVATTILATEIGATIPNDINIFVHSATKQPRSISEIANFVYELVEKQGQAAAATA
jgi:hypothetical protein